VIQVPKGTFDVLPADAARREVVEAHARRILSAAGFERIETPVFEATELFARGVGESTDIVQKEMYTFDDGGGRSVTLRPEGTAPIARAYVEHGMHKLPQPVKLWYLSTFFRREAPQKGRYRQFWQIGAETIGASGPAADAELIALMADLLDAVGVRGTRLRLGSLATPETRAAYKAELVAYLRAHEAQLSAEARGRIDSNPLRAFDATDPGTQGVMAGAPRLLDRLSGADLEHFETVKALLDGAGVAYVVDPTLVRGLDYYARTVWEFTSHELGAQSGVGGGGRYDDLIEQLGGPATPGVGFAAGVERILLAAGEQPIAGSPPDLFVAIDGDAGVARTAFELANQARRARLSAQVQLDVRGLKGQLKHADRLQARYVAIVGPEQARLKEMQSGEQRELPVTDVIPTILRGSRLA
jgi:histidyl-tRNA synthetase